MSSSSSETLEALLRESPDHLARQQQEQFQELCASRDGRLVLFGAGGLGRKALRGLRSLGIEPIAFSDNNSELWGREVEGTPVLPPPEAAGRFGDGALFVVTIWSPGSGHRYVETRARLTDLGCTAILPFLALFR